MSDTELAVVELLGALAYGQLRGFASGASAVGLAPDVVTAAELADHAAREHERWTNLRTRLGELTDLPAAVLERQREAFDVWFERPPTTWLGATVSLAVGLPLSADFARAVAPVVDGVTRDVLVESLTDRHTYEDFALEELRSLLEADPDARAAARGDVAELIGHALTGYQNALARTDALRVLFEQHAQQEGLTSEGVVKRLAIQVLEAHRRRMLALGLDDLE